MTKPRVLLLIPPMTQLNTPYPSTAYLSGFLRSRGVEAVQADLALELVLRLLSRAGLNAMREQIQTVPGADRGPQAQRFVELHAQYAATIEPLIAFLQHRDSTLAHRIVSRRFLPEGPRFAALDVYVDDQGGDPMAWAFGALGIQDRARHLATLYLNDLADVLREAIDPRFEFVRYAESLAQSQASFDPLAEALAASPTLVDRTLQQITREVIEARRPDLVLVSVPFPGSVYGAFRIAQQIRATSPQTQIALGGGYANTELRELAEPRVFDFFDYVTLDAGEMPVLALVEYLRGQRPREALIRCFVRQADGRVHLLDAREPDIAFNDVGIPTWDGLPLDRYLSLLDMLNPMHRLWSDGRWNKLTAAHGCYWKKCSFCDVSLDYISRYDAASAATLVDRVEAIVRETGQTGFHLVDEAAPPKVLKAFAQELLRRGVAISWWGNIRFEKSFNPALCRLLADSGCIAISGGLEVASDRLLKLMQKGVTVEQVARVTHAFTDAGIRVHAYLMYGFPTQTVQDTVDALEYVRQMFEAGCLDSGFWHRFTCTVHSPVGRDPGAYGIELVAPLPGAFARNDIGFIDPTGVDHDALGIALNQALYNYMHGIGLEQDVRRWFDQRVPRPRVPQNFIARALET